MLPPLSKGWAYGGPAGSRKEEVDTQTQEGEKAVEGKPDAHRILPPLSKGWAYGGPAGSRKDVDTQGQQEENKGN